MVISLAASNYLGIFDAVFFYVGGNGVRQRSKAAAICVFIVYAMGSVVMWTAAYAGGGPGQIVRVFLTALLLSNVRGIWMASAWRKRGAPEESAIVLNESFADKLSGVWPRTVWARLRIVFFIFAAVEMLGSVAIVIKLSK